MTRLLAVAFTVVLASCSLDIEESDSIITNEGTFSGVTDPAQSINDLYGEVTGEFGSHENWHALSEVTTEEQLVPTRGTDWGDNGIWRSLHNHTWNSSHNFILNAWNEWNQIIFNATEVIDPLSEATAEQVANAKFLRAHAMFVVMDLWGIVPFREPSQAANENPIVIPRTEALTRILTDLDDAIADLPTRTAVVDHDDLDRASKASARFLKAKVLLNSHIYNETGTPANTDLQEVIDLVDAIEADGFGLQAGYFDLFGPDADTETIWWVGAGIGNSIYNGLHYNQNHPDQGGGWNGFSTLGEFYDLFEGPADQPNAPGLGQEERRGFVPDETTSGPTNFGLGFGFLQGQQYGADDFDDNDNPIGGYKALRTRPGPPLIFTREFPGLIGNDEANGMRLIKYHPAVSGGSFTGHKIVYRFADAHLMRAEAMQRSGSGDALGEVNELRTLRDATALSALTEQDLIDERGRELYMEQWRRNDLIRFGQFLDDYEFKDPEAIDNSTRLLFPIPVFALLSNPNLTQNDGY